MAFLSLQVSDVAYGKPEQLKELAPFKFGQCGYQGEQTRSNS